MHLISSAAHLSRSLLWFGKQTIIESRLFEQYRINTERRQQKNNEMHNRIRNNID